MNDVLVVLESFPQTDNTVLVITALILVLFVIYREGLCKKDCRYLTKTAYFSN